MAKRVRGSLVMTGHLLKNINESSSVLVRIDQDRTGFYLTQKQINSLELKGGDRVRVEVTKIKD